MKAHVPGLSRIVVAGMVLLTATAVWGAPRSKLKFGDLPAPSNEGRVSRVSRVSRESRESFSLSTTYTGFLGKTLKIGGVDYRVSPRATIYVVEKGVAEPGFPVYDAHLYIAGRRVGSEAIVTQILVRPKSAPGWGEKTDVGILPPGSPN